MERQLVFMTCGGLEVSRRGEVEFLTGLFNKILVSERIWRNGGEEY